jgi:hypothetical protein
MLALTLGNMGDQDATPALNLKLEYPDPDVRWVAAIALNKVGDRRALSKLRKVIEGKTFWGDNVKGAAQNAIKEIEERHPLSKVKKLSTYQWLLEKQAIKPTIQYKNYDSVVCLAALSNLDPNTRIRFCCNNSYGTTVFQQEEMYSKLLDQINPMPSSLQIETDDNPISPLVELVDLEVQPEVLFDPEENTHSRIEPGSILVEIPPPTTTGWRPDEYAIELYIFNNETAIFESGAKVTFRIVE